MNPVGVVGLGIVGTTIQRAFSDVEVPTRGYDRYLSLGRPSDLAECSVVFLCVPTPSGPDGSHDLTEVHSALRTIAAHLDRGTVVALKSTIPPGTCEALSLEFPDIELAFVPEFLVATRPTETFTRPDRIVIGASTGRVAELLANLMSLAAPGAPVIIVTPTEAELIKLCSNAMLAAKVALANELAEVCARFGVEWPRVQPAVGLDRRIGPDHLTVTPERGFGGACLPKDLDGLIASAKAAGYQASLLEQIAEFNLRIRREAIGRQEIEEMVIAN